MTCSCITGDSRDWVCFLGRIPIGLDHYKPMLVGYDRSAFPAEYLLWAVSLTGWIPASGGWFIGSDRVCNGFRDSVRYEFRHSTVYAACHCMLQHVFTMNLLPKAAKEKPTDEKSSEKPALGYDARAEKPAHDAWSEEPADNAWWTASHHSHRYPIR